MHLSRFVFKFWLPAVIVCFCCLLTPPSAALTACHEIMTPNQVVFLHRPVKKVSRRALTPVYLAIYLFTLMSGSQTWTNTRLWVWSPHVSFRPGGACAARGGRGLSLGSGGDRSIVTWVLSAD